MLEYVEAFLHGEITMDLSGNRDSLGTENQ
jgi:hypothetical protein